MVAENDEKWYAGSTEGEDNLSFILEKDNAPPLDQPPLPLLPVCNLCSEARYEVKMLLTTFFCSNFFETRNKIKDTPPT